MIKNKRNKNILISTAEKNLILNSSICVKDNELKNVLSSFKKSISNDNLESIKNTNPRIYQNIKAKESREEIIETASKEWKNEKPKGREKHPCELCENVKSEFKYLILNTITHKRLEVGSSCIRKFPGMKEKFHGESTLTIDTWLKDSPEKIDRLGKFAAKFNGGKDIFQIWKVKYDAFDIEFPNEYDEEFRKIKSEANRIYSNYIKGTISDNELEKFQIYIDDFNYFYNKCEKFYNNNNSHKYICTKAISSFLKSKGLNTTLNTIKDKDCKIPKSLAKSIAEISFIKRFDKEIILEFSKFNINLKKIDPQFLEFSYKYKTFNELKLIITPYEFVNLHSELFYGKSALTDTTCFKLMILKNEQNNINEFLGIIEYWLNLNENYKIYNFYYDAELHEKQVVELHKKRKKVYATIQISEIRNVYIKLLYLKNEELNKFLNIKIQALNWITYEERKKNDIGNISSIFTLGKDN